MHKTLVLYTFNTFNESVYTFIKHGIFEDDNIDFLFICNNLNIENDIHIDIIPKYVTFIKRENTGFDFGAWSVGTLTNNRYKNYDYLIFINSSVIGPYLPEGYQGKWPNIFTSKLNQQVKLVGCTINTMNNPEFRSHIQSYCFAMDKYMFEFLVSKDIFSLTNIKNSKDDVIYQNEIPMSRYIIDAGYNISCLCPGFNSFDFTFKNYPTSEVCCVYVEPTHPLYYNIRWQSTDLIFIKRNRGYKLTDKDLELLKI